MKEFILTLTLVIATAAHAGQTETRSMDFDTCLKVMDQSLNKTLKTTYSIVANTSVIKIAKITTTDGSVIITCSAPDRQLTVSHVD